MVQETVCRPKFITRQMVRDNPDDYFVFGDNMLHYGMAGQARQMRGEPNVIGVPTKWRPSNDIDAFFSDKALDCVIVKETILDCFLAMKAVLHHGHKVYIPADGLGTGLADLPNRAPKIHQFIEEQIVALSETK